MRQDLMEILVCPLCKGTLTLTIAAVEGDEVLTGVLTCAACNQQYPIDDGIPNLLPPEMRQSMAAAEGAGSPGGH
jgi:uncharacterized protein YbaR (Trm112 family)